MVKIYTTNILSGGSGKTSVTGNGIFYLGNMKDKKVLGIDINTQCDLTDRFIKISAKEKGLDYKEVMSMIDEDKHTVKGIFTGGSPAMIKITDNIDLIAGYKELGSLTHDVERGLGRKALLIWYKRHEEILKEYDYILIDTPNDKSIFTINALVVADYIVAVVDVDDTTLDKVPILEEDLEFIKSVELMPNLTSFVNAEIVVVGNKFNNAKNAPNTQKEFIRKFKKLMENEPEKYLGFFEQRDAFAKFKTSGEILVELAKIKHGQSQSEKAFYERTWKLYDKLYNVK